MGKLKQPPEGWEDWDIWDDPPEPFNRCTCGEYDWPVQIDPFNAEIWDEEVETVLCPYCYRQRFWDI